jgi:PhnB protein
MNTEYSTVCPYLMIKDIDGQIDFLVKIFEASIKEQLRMPDGKTQHAEVKIGDTVIMLSRLENGNPSRPSTNYVFVNDADNTFKSALLNGATEISKPDDKFYGIREAGITDLEGNTWWIGQHIKEVTVKEMEEGLAKRKIEKLK